jgi:hypothetical protein
VKQQEVDSLTGPDVDLYYKHALPNPVAGWPNGWMSANDLKLLYNVAIRTTGPVLEVGPWLGRSTTAILLGLKAREDSGESHVFFDTIDYGITSVAEWRERFGELLKPDKDFGRVMDAVYHPGGTIAVLLRNIKDNRLLPYVTNVVRGDFNTCPLARKYKLIFCDATHDDKEIADNLPRLASLGDKGCTYVFDDVITQERADKICMHLDVKSHFMTRAVFPARSKRCKLLIVETK